MISSCQFELSHLQWNKKWGLTAIDYVICFLPEIHVWHSYNHLETIHSMLTSLPQLHVFLWMDRFFVGFSLPGTISTLEYVKLIDDSLLLYKGSRCERNMAEALWPWRILHNGANWKRNHSLFNCIWWTGWFVWDAFLQIDYSSSLYLHKCVKGLWLVFESEIIYFIFSLIWASRKE